MRATLAIPNDPALLEAALEGIIEVNRLLIRRGAVPGLYESGVRYSIDTPGHLRWQTAEETVRRRSGDCKDLVTYRCAELREQGVDARPRVIPIKRKLWHVVLEADGWLEDPSAYLGMLTPATINRRRKAKTMDDDTTDTIDPQNTAATTAGVAEQLVDDPVHQIGTQALEQGALNMEAIAGAVELAADADATAMERAPVPIKPSVRYLVRRRPDGTHDAHVEIRLMDGSVRKPVVHATTRQAALTRAAQLAQKELNNPAVQMLVPPQAVVAVRAILHTAKLAANGQLAERARTWTSAAMRTLASVFS